jgi:AraC-like DNA-binding protein
MRAPNLRARFFAPPERLAGCFTSFYLLEVDLADGARVEDYLHPEWGNLRFFFGALPDTERADGTALIDTPFTATGPSSCPVRFRLPATRMWGIGLLPLGWAKFMDVPASEFADTISDGMTHPAFARFVPLYEALRGTIGSEDEQAEIISEFFLARDRAVRNAPQIAAVHAALVDPDVNGSGQLAERAHITQRSLERLCARYFGFTPQHLVRRQRIMRTLSAFMLAERANWSQVIDAHYSDHAHFTHEFHAFMDMSPREYAALDHPILSAFMAERARIMGSPVQTLDRPSQERGQAH